jgi:hypothetical protein
MSVSIYKLSEFLTRLQYLGAQCGAAEIILHLLKNAVGFKQSNAEFSRSESWGGVKSLVDVLALQNFGNMFGNSGISAFACQLN